MPEERWYVLIHQLPPRPLYLRAKVRNRLTKVGAVALKNSVYVLPRTDDCLEDLHWIAQEAVAGGGEAFICDARFVAGTSNDALAKLFQAERQADYASLTGEIREALASLKRRSGVNPPEQDLTGRLARLRKRLDEIKAIDFFTARGRRESETALRTLEDRLRPKAGASAKDTRKHRDLLGRTWVTRRGIQIDRIASAWLVRRFIDPNARFRFMDPKEGQAAIPGEIRFDMMPGDFTHEGDRCTYETLVARAGLADPALSQIAEIVHDIDLKDGKYGRADAPGIQRLLIGLVLSHPDDEARLARGFALFDDLYRSFSSGAAGGVSGKKTASMRGRR
ncbi:MAG: chromate resistance protein ChrB domain-containing protein [Acidobacteriota bacterium]